MSEKSDAVIHAKPDSPIEDNPDRLLTFIRRYLVHGSARKAWVEAGYSENTVNKARNKLRENWRLVEKIIHEKIGDQISLALNVIKDLMLNSTSDTVRLNAAKDILHRAGLDQPAELRVEKVDAMTEVELNDELAALLDDEEVREAVEAHLKG